MPMPGPSLGAILLAAGAARRMAPSGYHKLLAEFDGTPLVRRAAQTLLSADVSPVLAVTGHRHQEIGAALGGLDIRLVFNPGYASGIGSSLACGFSDPGLSQQDGVLVMLADMPGITPDHVKQMAEMFRRHDRAAVLRASHDGQPGNPVIIPRALCEGMRRLTGDNGARDLIRRSDLPVLDVEIGPAALLDVDTAEAVTRAGGVLKG
ncbi:Nicotine blue oxidoreductase [Pseudogemmobacter humi]|uniref:Nicotine blue oxidoreductase n=2 Tax=Pseudogemmobacter humi TaxID=2483812 RepID=A0A3P5WTS6_9RHOB|nr:Nicotine blue oxidoreductase [Pseudogemmobacter humi]